MSIENGLVRFLNSLTFKKKMDDFFFKKLFVELSDSWYPIKAQCDTYLTKLFETGKIIVGDKLALFGCELSGPQEGYPPLEVD
jgi:hypothetical protein